MSCTSLYYKIIPVLLDRLDPCDNSLLLKLGTVLVLVLELYKK